MALKKGIVANLMVLFTCTGNGRAVVEGHTHPHPGPVASSMKSHTLPQDVLKQLDVGFLMELEGFAAKAGDTGESDISLATVELMINAEIVDGISGYVALLWEEDASEESLLNEGYITFGATEEIPFYATMGKMYLPFGNFESAFISDPLTLEMAEINQSAALAGLGNGWVDVNAGAFSGDIEGDAGDNTIDNAFASIVFMPSESLVFGAYWLSNLLETDGFEGVAGSAIADKSVGGAGVFLNVEFGPVSLDAEFVTALERFASATRGLLPTAYNIEASMPIIKKLSAGIKLEGSDDFYSDFIAGSPEGKFADWRTGFVVSYTLNEHVTLSGEYLHADGVADGETADMATIQVAVEL